MLLFGLLFAHGLHGESAVGHLKAGVAASLPVHDAESSADHDQRQHEDGESEVSAHTCAPGQPDDALPVPLPGTSPAVDHCHLAPNSSIRADIADPDTSSPGATTVLRI